MTDDVESQEQRPGVSSAAPSHCNNFEQRDVTAVARFVRLVWPDMSSTQIAANLGNRISASNVRQWRTGKRPVPPWVIEEVRKRTAAAIEAVDQIKTGPGKRAGWNNLGAWRATRNA